MTPRELAGWTPAERHEHYDAEDNLTGYTVVIRESRIDDADRRDLLALLRFRGEVCRCGFHPSLTDPESGNTFQPETKKCPVCAGEAQWSRHLHAADEKHAKANEDAPPLSPRPSDGRHSYMRFTPSKSD